ncbi:hypothetical protein B0H13DRAFT_2270651 [Mycena leptocephala]|nr:hypothetical protein B0H13DRAFT_2671739 [Mycena leptocephala]KAJ7914759.1 hypothetical protein B0H13DRAFT_2270651 [Mycena leptocephala]
MSISFSALVVQVAPDTTASAMPMLAPTRASPTNILAPSSSSREISATPVQLHGFERRARTHPGVSSSSISVSPSSSTSAAPNSSTSSFFQNKAAVTGVFITVGLVIAILLVSIITCLVRRRRQRQRQRDQEMDASFRQTMDRAANGWRQMPSLDRSAPWKKASSVYSAASHGTYLQPALSVAPPQYDSGFARRRDDAPSEHWDAELGGNSTAPRMVGEEITQPQRAAPVHPRQTSGDSVSVRALARRPSQSAVVHRAAPQVPANAHPSIYTSSPPPTDSVSPILTVSPVFPTSLPNPYDGQDQESQVRGTHLLSPNRPNSLSTSPTTPISPTPLPNPYDVEEREKRLTTNMPLSPMPLSPTPLPNPYG